MSEPFDEKIQRLKMEMTVAKQARNLWKILNEKRDLLEEKIAKLKTELDEEVFDYHRHAKQDSEENISITEKTNILKTIRDSKQEIDERLDKYEDFSHDMVECLEQELILTLLEKYPDQHVCYNELALARDKQSTLQDQLKTLHTSLNEINQLLKRAVEERQKSRPRNLLRFLFGRNPNVIITKCLQATKILSSTALDKSQEILSSLPDGHPAFLLIEQLLEALTKLQAASQQRWGYRKIDRIFAPLSLELKEYQEDLEAIQEKIVEELKIRESSIQDWINKLS